MNQTNTLLQEVSIIQKKYDEIAKITGENFNIFSVMNMEYDEVYTHSAIIGELLNPNGSHGQRSIFLNLFVEQISETFNLEEQLSKFDNLVDDKICERTISQSNNWENVTGGRIDIIIEDSEQILIIENKPGWEDQPFQLIRYNKYAEIKTPKKPFLFYLTLDGRDLKKEEVPYYQNDIEITGTNFKHDQKSEYDIYKTKHVGKDNIHHCLYYPISFEVHIRDWIERCINVTTENTILHSTLQQYLTLIKKITNQTTNDKMAEEIKKHLLNSDNSNITIDEKIKSAIGIYRVIEQTICEEFFNRIENKLNIGCENYNNNLIGKKNSGKWFPNKNGVLLWFRSEHEQLELGVVNNNIDWKKTVNINEHFDNLSWENILEDDNITAISKKIEQLINDIDSFKTE